jgi:hypothetical protein
MVHPRVTRKWVLAIAAAIVLAASPSSAEPPKGAQPPIEVKAVGPKGRSLAQKNRDFVEHLYRDLLGRQVDPTGLATFTRMLGEGVSRAQVAEAILASDEYRGAVIQDLYTRLLHRQADPNGLQAWRAFLANGGTAEQVTVTITGSQEYAQRAGSTSAAFVDQLYTDLLGRVADPQGRQAFVALLAQGASHATVAQTIVASAEYARVSIESMYRRFLHRATDPGGLAAFTPLVQRGQVRAVIVSILASTEYFERTSAA